MLTFGFLLSGFFLLVSHISQMDPQISHLMPVLNSPLLTIHVSIIMMSFALLSLTCICGITAFIMRRQAEELKLLSQALPLPCPHLSGLRHLHRCHLGECVMGYLLELGPEGDMGTHHLYDLCRRCP